MFVSLKSFLFLTLIIIAIVAKPSLQQQQQSPCSLPDPIFGRSFTPPNNGKYSFDIPTPYSGTPQSPYNTYPGGKVEIDLCSSTSSFVRIIANQSDPFINKNKVENVTFDQKFIYNQGVGGGTGYNRVYAEGISKDDVYSLRCSDAKSFVNPPNTYGDNTTVSEKIGFRYNYYASSSFCSTVFEPSNDSLRAFIYFVCPTKDILASSSTASSSPICENSTSSPYSFGWVPLDVSSAGNFAETKYQLVIMLPLLNYPQLCQDQEVCSAATSADECSKIPGCFANAETSITEIQVPVFNSTENFNSRAVNLTGKISCLAAYSRGDLDKWQQSQAAIPGSNNYKNVPYLQSSVCVLKSSSLIDQYPYDPSGDGDTVTPFSKNIPVNVSATTSLENSKERLPTSNPCDANQFNPTLIVVAICTVLLASQMYIYGNFNRIVRHERLHVAVDAFALIGFFAAFVSVLTRTIPTSGSISGAGNQQQAFQVGKDFSAQDISWTILPTQYFTLSEVNDDGTVVARYGPGLSFMTRVSNFMDGGSSTITSVYCNNEELNVFYLWFLFGLFCIISILEFVAAVVGGGGLLAWMGRFGGAGSIYSTCFPPKISAFTSEKLHQTQEQQRNSSSSGNYNDDDHDRVGADQFHHQQSSSLPGASSWSLSRMTLRVVWAILQISAALPVSVIVCAEPHLFAAVALRLWRISDVVLRDVLLPPKIHAELVRLSSDNAVVFCSGCRGSFFSLYFLKKLLGLIAWLLLLAAALTFSTPLYASKDDWGKAWYVCAIGAVSFCLLARLLNIRRIVVRSGSPRPRIHYQSHSVVLPFLVHTHDITARIELMHESNRIADISLETCCEGSCYTVRAKDFIKPSGHDHCLGRMKQIFYNWFGMLQPSVFISPDMKFHIPASSYEAAKICLQDLIFFDYENKTNRDLLRVEPEDHDVAYCLQALSAEWLRFVRRDDPYFTPEKQKEMLHMALARYSLDLDSWAQITASMDLEKAADLKKRFEREVEAQKLKMNNNNKNNNSDSSMYLNNNNNNNNNTKLKTTAATTRDSMVFEQENYTATMGEKLLSTTITNRRIFIPLVYFMFCLFYGVEGLALLMNSGTSQLLQPAVGFGICAVLMIIHIALLREDAATSRLKILNWADVMVGTATYAFANYQSKLKLLPVPYFSRSLFSCFTLYLILFPLFDLVVTTRFTTIIQSSENTKADLRKRAKSALVAEAKPEDVQFQNLPSVVSSRHFRSEEETAKDNNNENEENNTNSNQLQQQEEEEEGNTVRIREDTET